MRLAFWILTIGVGLAGVFAGVQALLPERVEAQSRAPDESPCPAARQLALRLGVGDDSEVDWSGTAEGAVAPGADSWEVMSEASPVKLAGGGLSPRVLPAEVSIPLSAGNCDGPPSRDLTVAVTTGQGSFSVRLADLEMGSARSYLDGRAEVSLRPTGTKLISSNLDDDFPSCAALVDGTVACAYVEYEPGAPIDEEAALAGRFESLAFSGNGDRIKWVHRSAAGWSEAIEVTTGGRDIWRPAVMALPTGGAAVVWSEQRSGNWDIYAREYSQHSGDFGSERRITEHPGSDISVAASGGFIAWQARRESGFDIYASTLDGAPVRVSQSEANDWRPSIAADGAGSAWIAWDTYQSGNYDVLMRRFDGESAGEVIPIATSGRFEARASVAVDQMGRAWVAFEDSDEGWGKDYGDRWTGTQATPMYVNKNILVRVWDGALRQTALPPLAPTVDYYHDDPRIATSQRNKISIPVLTFDGNGLPWVFYRRHPLQTGRGEVWRSYGAYYAGGSWSRPIPLRSSDHLLDRSPGLAGLPDGSLIAVVAGDARTNARDRQDSDLHSAVLNVGTPTVEPKLVPVSANQPDLGADPVHPNETAQVAALRARRILAGSLSLQFLRGEFHRHSAFSSHRDWDGPFEDVWRYGLDVAALDWIGPGDHDYAVAQDYLWWLQQKASDMFHTAGRFSAMFTYERNVSYPSGHRNVMLPRRGIRPVPRMRGRENMNGTSEDGAPDIKNLFAYLRHFGGICSSHTSATNMGTDWRDGDGELEPVVEIFQGHRQSYELSGGPFAATGPEDTIQGYRPAGFVWEAFQRGRRLGFQASSDHVSTHLSYAIVLAEENSRRAIIDAFKRRHSYAAQDNIALVVRSGEHLMGDEFTSSSMPRLRIAATGTTEIDSVEIVRQVGLEKPTIVAAMEPRVEQVNLEWSDPAARPGEWNMYYVRISQRNNAMAWASPMWIRYEP